MLCVPGAANALVVKEAAPVASSVTALPKGWPLSVKLMVPVGTTAALRFRDALLMDSGVIATVNVTSCPSSDGFGEEVTLISEIPGAIVTF